LVLLLAWETLLPTIGPFPVTWQTRAIAHSLVMFHNWKNESMPENRRGINHLRKTMVSWIISEI
jgi:hypothetical protein